MNFVRRAVAVLTTITVAGGLVVFDVVGTDDPNAVTVVPAVQTLALAGELAVDPSEEDAAGASLLLRGGAEETSYTSSTIEADEFTMVGVTWDGDSAAPDDLDVQVRTRGDGDWSEWTALEPMDAAPHPGTEEAELAAGTVGTEPLTTNRSDQLQVRVASGAAELPEDLSAVAIDPGTAPTDGLVQDSIPLSGADANSLRPPVVTRAQWGADESRRRCNPSYSSTVLAGAVHHTAGTNNYTRAESAGIVRGIYAYHTGSLGWCDVGYNFLVDKYGTVFEGRFGGMERAVRGAHSGGFNDNTSGVAALGNYETVAAPAAMVQAMGRIIGWKLSLTDRTATDTVTLTSAGGGTSRYPAGRVVSVPAVFAHRDVGQTACPGRNLFAAMGALRAAAATYAGFSETGNLLAAVEVDGTAGHELLSFNRATRTATFVDLSSTGVPTPLSSSRWASWTHVVPVEVDGTRGDELLLYDTISGRQIVVDLDRTGRVSSTLSETTWSQWDTFVPVEVDGSGGDELLVYDTQTGRQFVVDLSEKGRASRPLSQTTWSKWDVVVPVEVDGSLGDELLVYDTRTGRQLVVDLSRTGMASRPLSQTTWSQWDVVVPVEVDGSARDELLVYDRQTGKQVVVDLSVTGMASRPLSQTSWPLWETVLPLEIDGTAGSELVVYSSATGQQQHLDLPRGVSRVLWPR